MLFAHGDPNKGTVFNLDFKSERLRKQARYHTGDFCSRAWYGPVLNLADKFLCTRVDCHPLSLRPSQLCEFNSIDAANIADSIDQLLYVRKNITIKS